ncbi:MAG: 50S ribosomal protein L23 [Rickettsiales bacterium]|nr:50S ribosomal protein L23 [Rickettsiales bacterium]MCA0253968.1 50S ribosomal protein L23 [Pseudomonadota bacterium]
MSVKIKYDLIRRPIITEKSTILGELGKYVFEVSSCADKHNIKKAIEAIFGVKVKAVNVLNQKGKTKRFKGVMGRRSDIKKAIVTLEKDNTIDLAGGVK